MTAYYNEHDPAAAQWLRNLIAMGAIAPGDVDERSITEVQPDDLAGYTQCHFFAGIGGWSVAARLAGWPDNRPLWTGSCPCQPFSVAGQGLGTDDARHLWPDFHRLIRAARPAVVVGEQVAGKAGYGWFDGVRADLARDGYASRGVDIPALAVNAPHQRQRLYWVAVADADRCGRDGRSQGPQRGAVWGDAAERPDGDLAYTRRELRGARPPFSPDGCFRPDRDAPGHLGHAIGARLEGHAGHGDGNGRPHPARPVAQADGGNLADADRKRLYNGGHVEAAGTTRALSGAAEEREWVRPDDRKRPDAGGFWSDAEWLACHDGKARRTERGLPLLAHGVSGGGVAVGLSVPGVSANEAAHVYHRITAWRGFGNAIVPQLGAVVLAALADTLDADDWRVAA